MRNHFVNITKMVALAMLALFTACATINGPQTTEDRIQYAKAGLAVQYNTISNLAVRGRITKDEGLKLLGSANTAETALKAAESALSAGQYNDATAQLNVALTALAAIERYLQEKQE